MLTSWAALLEFMERVVGRAGDVDTEADIRQLRSVLNRLDEDAFVS